MTTVATCKVGDDAAVTWTYTALGTNTPADPDDVYVLLRLPDLTEVEYVYPDDEEITKLGTGSYQFKRRYTEARRHVLWPLGVGNVNKADTIFIDVEEAYFKDPLP